MRVCPPPRRRCDRPGNRLQSETNRVRRPRTADLVNRVRSSGRSCGADSCQKETASWLHDDLSAWGYPGAFALVGLRSCPIQGGAGSAYRPASRRTAWMHDGDLGIGGLVMRTISLVVLGAAAGASVTMLATQEHFALAGSSTPTPTNEVYRQLNAFGNVFDRVRANYVDKPDDQKLIQSAVSGMLRGLDPHSSYMDPNSFRELKVDTRGEFGGLGIEVTLEDGLVKVIAPIDDTPAAKAGILAGDLIIKLDGQDVQGLTINQAVERMRGPVGSKIRLTIVRKGQDKPLDVTLARDVIHVSSVRFHKEGDDVGYIRVTQFNEQTTDGLKKAIADISGQIPGDKLKGYVLDLRNNPGGLLDQAISVSNSFKQGEIVSTRGRNPDES